MNRPETSGAGRQLFSALARMVEALGILDELEAPGEIGAQLDLAIARLADRLQVDVRPHSPAMVRAKELDDRRHLGSSAWDGASANPRAGH